MKTASTLRSALLSLALVAGLAQAGAAQAADQAASRPQDLTRAEVVADFNLWHRAGLDQFMNTSHKKHEVRLRMEFVDDREPNHPHTLTAEELARITGDEDNDCEGSDANGNERDEQKEEEEEEESFSVLSEGEDEEAEAEDDEDDSQYSE